MHNSVDLWEARAKRLDAKSLRVYSAYINAEICTDPVRLENLERQREELRQLLDEYADKLTLTDKGVSPTC